VPANSEPAKKEEEILEGGQGKAPPTVSKFAELVALSASGIGTAATRLVVDDWDC
jgi:hypothetical protein